MYEETFSNRQILFARQPYLRWCHGKRWIGNGLTFCLHDGRYTAEIEVHFEFHSIGTAWATFLFTRRNTLNFLDSYDDDAIPIPTHWKCVCVIMINNTKWRLYFVANYSRLMCSFVLVHSLDCGTCLPIQCSFLRHNGTPYILIRNDVCADFLWVEFSLGFILYSCADEKKGEKNWNRNEQVVCSKQWEENLCRVVPVPSHYTLPMATLIVFHSEFLQLSLSHSVSPFQHLPANHILCLSFARSDSWSQRKTNFLENFIAICMRVQCVFIVNGLYL